MKKWLIGAISSVVIIPAVAMSWRNLNDLWAAPEEVASIKKTLASQTDEQKAISKLVLEQQYRMDKQEALYQQSQEFNKQQLELIADIKKGKK